MHQVVSNPSAPAAFNVWWARSRGPALYGIGAIVGPLAVGRVADRTGFGPALRAAYLVQAVAVAMPALVLALVVDLFSASRAK